MKYHGHESLAAIPTSLRRAYAHPQQDKSRFSLGEPPSTRQKTSFDAAEEDKSVKEVDAALDPADSVHYLNLSTTKCICGFADDGISPLINCHACGTVQHFECYCVDENGDILELGEHYCIDCKPRLIDAKLATIRQKDRKKERLEYLQAVKLARDEVSKKGLGQAGLNIWSVQEEEIVRRLVHHHGTNMKGIVEDMRSKTALQVCNSVFGIGSIADRFRTRFGNTMSELLPAETNNGRKTCSFVQNEVWRSIECC